MKEIKLKKRTIREQIKKHILSIAMASIANDPKQIEMWTNIFMTIIEIEKKTFTQGGKANVK